MIFVREAHIEISCSAASDLLWPATELTIYDMSA
jgi:hypothetical protein